MGTHTARVDRSTLHSLLSAEDPDAVMRRTVGAVTKRVEADRAVLAFGDGDVLEAVQIAGEQAGDEWDRRWTDPADPRVEAAERGETRLVDSYQSGEGHRENRRHSLLCAPVEDYGVLFVEATESHAFEEDDRAWLEEITTYLGAALDRFDAPAAAVADDRTETGNGVVDRSDGRLPFLLDATDSILWELDLDTDDLQLSGPVERLLGTDGQSRFTRSEFIESYVHPDDTERVSENVQRVTRREADDIEVRHRVQPGDGTESRWFRVRAAVEEDDRRKLVGLSTDVTEQVTREHRIKQLQRRTTRLIGADTTRQIANIAVNAAGEALTLPMSGIHLRDGDVLEAVAVNEPVWETFDEMPDYHADSESPTETFVWDAFEDGRPKVVEDTADHPQLQGTDHVRSAVVYPLDDHGVFIASSPEPHAFDSADVAFGEVIAMSIVAALDRAEQERQLKDQAEELEHKNERLEEFASIVSHDLRNPLNVALGRIEYVRKRLDGEYEHLRTAEAALERMESIIDETLVLARQGHTVESTGPVEVRAVIEQCWRNVATADAELQVSFDDATEPTVEADEERLAHVFENLFRNAVEHNDEAVTLRVGPLDDGDGFYVEDDGHGIPPSEREEVFEAGYTTAENGTGFGLSLVRDIVEAHGWRIDVTEGADGGARFEVRTD